MSKWHIEVIKHKSGIADTFDIVEGAGADANSIAEVYYEGDANGIVALHNQQPAPAASVGTSEDRIERAKAAGWRIECLGDQWEGLFNYLLWSPDNGYSIQTEYQLANENEAWEYFYGFVVGLPAPAASGTGTAGVSLPLDGETFDEWVTRVGKPVEETAFYWKQIAADNLELAAANADELARVKAALAQIDEYATEELGEWLPVQEEYMPTDKLTFKRIHEVALQAGEGGA